MNGTNGKSMVKMLAPLAAALVTLHADALAASIDGAGIAEEFEASGDYSAAALEYRRMEAEADPDDTALRGALLLSAARDYFIKRIESAWVKTQLADDKVITKRLFEAQDIMLDTSSTTQKVSLTRAPTAGEVDGATVGDTTIAAATLLVRFIMLPKRGSENIPETILDRYGTAIIHGALASLFAMLGREWSDAQQAQIESALYDKAVEDASEMTVFGDQIGNGRYILRNEADGTGD